MRTAQVTNNSSSTAVISVSMAIVLTCCCPRGTAAEQATLQVLTFNILQGGGNAANVGFLNQDFEGSRMDDIAAVIRFTKADIVGIQENASGNLLLTQLGPGWYRGGTVYARFPLQVIQQQTALTVARVALPDGTSVIVVNCHWAPSRYGPFRAQELLQEGGFPDDPQAFAAEVIRYSAKPDGPRGYKATINAIQSYVQSGQTVFLTGDFNEPSHLDWTDRWQKHGRSRWVESPANRPLNQAIAWPGSLHLSQQGMQDAYRVVKPDEVKAPGNTWTPRYPTGTSGRRDYGMQVRDRIDMIYFHSASYQPVEAFVVGEQSAETELVWPGRWPSDHRAVLVKFDRTAAAVPKEIPAPSAAVPKPSDQ